MCLRVPKKAGSECGKRQAHASIGEKQGRATPEEGRGGATELAAVRSSAQDSMAEAELLVLHDDGHLARRGTQDYTTRSAQHLLCQGGILSYLCADLVDLLRVLPQFGRQLVVVTDLELQQRNHDVNTCVVMDNAEAQRRAWA